MVSERFPFFDFGRFQSPYLLYLCIKSNWRNLFADPKLEKILAKAFDNALFLKYSAFAFLIHDFMKEIAVCNNWLPWFMNFKVCDIGKRIQKNYHLFIRYRCSSQFKDTLNYRDIKFSSFYSERLLFFISWYYHT